MASGILIDGLIVDLLHPITKHPIPVFGPEDTGMEFKPGDGYNKRRRVAMRAGIIHWTGSENPPETMFRTLNRRKLGVEFCITQLGSVYQFCDPCEVDTADAGAANKFSWGVEMICDGLVRKGKPTKTPKHMPPRTKYKTEIHGAKVTCRQMYPAQLQSLFALNALMADNVPAYGEAVCLATGVINFKRFRGAMGHYNLNRGKTDPGPHTMHALRNFMATRHLTGEEIDALEDRDGR
ncbi:MAG: N-acetylmuramoyl-L-alanine amidase [Gammaproteobacteria bacterium]|nr:N-acetylmuramoyl-L-alanine amidase [Gammaproteobacteria bacterium]